MPNPDDPPRQRMLDKLVAAGWIESSVSISEATPSDPYAGRGVIKWTNEGRERMAMLLELIHEIEKRSTPLCSEELIWLKALAELAVISGGPRGGRIA